MAENGGITTGFRTGRSDLRMSKHKHEMHIYFLVYLFTELAVNSVIEVPCTVNSLDKM